MSPKQSDLEVEMALHLRSDINIPEPVTEYEFAKTLGRKWRFDFAWPDVRVALEIEGGTFIQGAHTRGKHFESDAEKYNTAVLLGWAVIRATKHMVKDGRAFNTIRAALMLRGGM